MMLNNLNNRDLVAIDVETSGTNPFRHDVLAVGLVPLNRELPSALVYVRPGATEWNDFARQNFERFSSEWEAGALVPHEACDAIEAYLAETFGGRTATPIGHNVGFDLAFLRRLAFLGGREQLDGLSHRAIDTHTLLYLLTVQGKIPEDAITSDGAFRYFGITVADRLRHTALGDATATSELVKRVFEAILGTAGSPAPPCRRG
ncbi:MAG: DNA polymerase III subunit epsilon [Candidatus Accumulibacter appositus]|uniref:DNA polymerase III subunit epsilon n=1 Tax=Candidatus Accumulibacter appositus TaxID=1454003 RepID=A0A011QH86_9PROT|nr:MAG: DNA polymerase III subunit epsilon [Candidatus Accumulibacter appositus]